VVGDDFVGMWRAFQERTLFLEGTNNYKKSFIIYLIVDLCWGMLSSEIGHMMKDSVIVILQYYSYDNKIRQIGLNHNFSFRVEVTEDQGQNKGLLQSLKVSLTGG
jgi:hypothetical protein